MMPPSSAPSPRRVRSTVVAPAAPRSSGMGSLARRIVSSTSPVLWLSDSPTALAASSCSPHAERSRMRSARLVLSAAAIAPKASACGERARSASGAAKAAAPPPFSLRGEGSPRASRYRSSSAAAVLVSAPPPRLAEMRSVPHRLSSWSASLRASICASAC